MARARQNYMLALRLTNAALRSPKMAKNDSTLFSVMILSMFEIIAGTNADSLVAWTEHINGAAALVKLRGRDQFKTEAGQRLFQQVTSNLMISCIQRNIPMPAHIIELREAFAEFANMSNPAWKLAAVIIDFTVFRAAVRHCQVSDPRNIVKCAWEFEQKFVDAFQDLPEGWKYKTFYTDEDPLLVWNKCYYVYQDAFSAQIWNGMRTCRILLHEIIRDQLTTTSEMCPNFSNAEVSSIAKESARIMIEMQTDLLASVPHKNLNPLTSSSSLSLTYSILWPLYLVAVMDLSTEPIQAWVVQRLRTIADEVGIQQARVMADFLLMRKVLDPWNSVFGQGPHPYMPTRYVGASSPLGVDLNREINFGSELPAHAGLYIAE